MADPALLEEAYKRGILPEEMVPLYEEAKKRGLIGGQPSATQALPDDQEGFGDILNQVGYGAGRMINKALTPVRWGAATLAHHFKAPEAVQQYLNQPGGIPFVEGQEPTTAGGRIARRVGEDIAINAPLAAMPMAAAGMKQVPEVSKAAFQAASDSEVAKIVSGTPGLLSHIWQNYLQGIRATPMMAATGELGATVGAGIGGGVAREIVPESPSAELAGGLAGGVAGGAVPSGGVTGALARPVTSFVRRFTPEGRRIMGVESASKQLQDINQPEYVARLQEADQMRRQIPGFEPSLAESTDLPSAVVSQRHIESQASGHELDELARRKQASIEAVTRQADVTAPPAGALPAETALDIAGARVASVEQGIEAQKAAARQRGEIIAEEVFPIRDRTEAGQVVRERYNVLRQKTRDQMSAEAERLGINDAPNVPFEKLQERFRELLPKSEFADPGDTPQVVRQSLARKTADEVLEGLDESGQPIIKQTEAKPVTFQDVKAIRERLSDELVDTLSSASPSRGKIRNLIRAKREVDDFLETDFAEANPQMAENYRAFRDMYRTDYIDRFERGAAFKVHQGASTGEYRTGDEKIAGLFFKPGDVTSAKQFRATFGDDAEANAAMRDVILDKAREASISNGMINPKRIEAFVRRNESVLDQFPDIKKELSSTEGIAKALAARMEQLEERGKGVAKSILASLTKKDPDVAIDQALKDPEKMKSLLRSRTAEVDLDEQRQAIRRAVWDRIMKEGGDNQIPDGRRMLEYMNDPSHQRSISMALSPAHFANLRVVARGYEMLGRVPIPQGKSTIVNPFRTVEETLGMTIPTASTRIINVEAGRLSWRHMATDAMQRITVAASKRSADRALREALYNPDVARDLADMVRSNGAHKAARRRLNTYLVPLGFRGAFGEDENAGNRP